MKKWHLLLEEGLMQHYLNLFQKEFMMYQPHSPAISNAGDIETEIKAI